MKNLSVALVLIGGLAQPVWADEAAAPSVTVEAPVEAAAPGEVVEPAASAEVESKPESKPDASTETAVPAAPAAEEKSKPKNDALQQAAQDDPDVAARMETAYPLDGEEWKEYPLGVLELEMQEAIEDLANGKTKPPSLVTQPRIISRLDLLITELEKKASGSGSAPGAGMGGNKPAEKSVLRKGKMKDGQMRAVKNEGDRWADIPPKEREKILQSQGEGFPAGYEDVLADYFRKLSKSEKPAAAPK